MLAARVEPPLRTRPVGFEEGFVVAVDVEARKASMPNGSELAIFSKITGPEAEEAWAVLGGLANPRPAVEWDFQLVF